MTTVLYLIGGPATGKSALMRHLTRHAHRTPHPQARIPHDTLRPPRSTTTLAVEIGVQRNQFSGTDALDMAINPAATASLTDGTWDGVDLLLGEGDRLANLRFLTHAHAHHRLRVALLRADPATVAERCAQRGSTQSPSWVRGRTTKAERLASRLDAAGVRVLDLDAARPLPDLARDLHRHIPALEVFA